MGSVLLDFCILYASIYFFFFFFFFLENAVFVVKIRFLRTLTTEDCLVLGDLSVSFTKRVDAGPGPS